MPPGDEEGHDDGDEGAAGASGAETANPEGPEEKRRGAKKRKKFVIPDEPLELEALDAADVDIRLTIGNLTTYTTEMRDVEIGVHLQDRRLRIDPLSAEDRLGGRVRGRLTFEPAGEEDFRLAVRVDIDDLRLGWLSEGGNREIRPPLSIGVNKESKPNSARKTAAQAATPRVGTHGTSESMRSAWILFLNRLVKNPPSDGR